MADASFDLGKEKQLLKPIGNFGKSYCIASAVLLAVIIWAVYVYNLQFHEGLGVTGMNRPVYWGVYITNFVFFIGISHAGTLISAILRLTKAEWRRSITRSAETITVLVLFFGVGNILIDLGRPDRVFFVFKHAQFRSPLIWDVISIGIYLAGSIIYLYLPMIPDIAILRDHAPRFRPLYRILALGWQGTEKEHARLERIIGIMAIIIIPIAVSVHTVVSWVFAMTIQPMWHSTIFGPYFVMGAIFSGIAALIIAMFVIRKAYHLEDYLRNVHFTNLGLLLLVMSCSWFYFTLAEFLTSFYGGDPVQMNVFWTKVSGKFSPLFWMTFAYCFIIPFAILCNRKTRTPVGTLIASVFVVIGMWLERFLIVVPTLLHPRLPYEQASYQPTWVEWSITAGSFSCFILLYMTFTKIFPIVSIWEVREGREKAVSEVTERVKTYLPGKEKEKNNTKK